MKSCENCGVPQEKRPGCANKCVTVALVSKNPKDNLYWHFAGWRTKEPKKTCGNCGWQDKTKKPIDCELQKNQTYCGLMKSYMDIRSIARKWDNCQWKPIVCETCQGTGTVCYEHCEFINTNCRHSECGHRDLCPDCQPKEPEKTCGNCGWFFNGKLKYNPNYGTCLNKENGWHNTTLSNRRVDDIDCKGWKPIVCKTCGGTGKICDKCGVCWDKCKNNAHIGIPELIPCPICQKPKEERLMVPVRWEKSKANEENSVLITNAGVIGSVTVTMDGLAFRATAVDKIIQDTSLSNHGGTKRFDDEQQAQQAVEKALGIKRG